MDSRALRPSSRRAFLAAVAALGGSGACARLGASVEPGVLTVLVGSEPEHLDPRFPADQLGASVSRLVFAGLMDSDPRTALPVPSLAESVEPLEGDVVRATLRPGVRFHDGSPVTARDVAATYRSMLDARIRSTVRGTLSQVFRDVRVVDPRTVDFVLAGPDGTYPSLLQLGILREVDAARGEIAALPGTEASFVGAGPMRVRSLARGAWELVRAARAVESARAGAVRLLTMHDPNTMALRLLHGGADVAEIKPDLVDVVQGREGFAVRSARGTGFTYVGLQTEHGALARPEVRRALAAAIDRPALMRGKLGRFGLEATGPVPPSHWAYEPGVTRHAYDPALARALLDAAGVRVGPDGARMRITLRVASARFTLSLAHALVEMWRAVGVEADVRPSELATLLSDLRDGRFDATVLTLPDLSDPWGLARMFSSSAIPTRENPGAGANRWRYRQPEVDTLLEHGRRAIGPTARRPYYARVQQILADDLPVIPLWHADVVYATGARVGALTPRGDAQLGFLLDVAFAG